MNLFSLDPARDRGAGGQHQADGDGHQGQAEPA